MSHLPALLRVGTRLTGQQADAEDLAQETLARALERRDELRDPAALKGWLLAVQRTTFLNSRRRMGPRLEVLQGGLAAADEPIVLPSHEAADGVGDELQSALDALPETWREALWLREVDELSYEEIARVLQCPVGTVRSRLARARGALLEGFSRRRKEASNGRMS